MQTLEGAVLQEREGPGEGGGMAVRGRDVRPEMHLPGTPTFNHLANNEKASHP